MGTITFLDSNSLEGTLYIGKKIKIQEASNIVGSATITKIFNKTLEKESNKNE